MRQFFANVFIGITLAAFCTAVLLWKEEDDETPHNL